MRRVLLGALRRVVRGWFRPEVHGCEHVPSEGGVIIASSHSKRVVDPLILAAVTPRGLTIVAHEDFRRRPIVHLVTRLQGAVFVASGPGVGGGFVAACEGILARGDALGIFPEGREMGGGDGVFRHGAAYLGLRNDCVLVPALVEHRGFRDVRVVYGAPIEPGLVPINRRTLEGLTTQLRAAIVALRTDGAAACPSGAERPRP